MKKLFILLTVIFLSTLYVFSQEKFISSDTLIKDSKYNILVLPGYDTIYINELHSTATEFLKNYDPVKDFVYLINKYKELYPKLNPKYDSLNKVGEDGGSEYYFDRHDFDKIINGFADFKLCGLDENMSLLSYNIYLITLANLYKIDTSFLKKFKFNIKYDYIIEDTNIRYFAPIASCGVSKPYDMIDVNNINKFEAYSNFPFKYYNKKDYNKAVIYSIKENLLNFLSEVYVSYIYNYLKNPFFYAKINFNRTIYLYLTYDYDNGELYPSYDTEMR